MQAAIVTSSQATQSSAAPQDRHGVPLVDLGHRQCRFPVWEDPSVPGRHFFCAEATSPDRRYCAKHQRVVSSVEQRRVGSRFTLPRRAA